MKEHNGFKYELRPDGKWTLFFPGGGKLIAPKQTEEELKTEIDTHLAQLPS